MNDERPHRNPDGRGPEAEGSTYLHGVDPGEQRRLSDLNDLMNDACLREIAVPPGARILDVGSGLGQFTRLLAREAGAGGHVVGVERDPRQIEEALRQAQAAGEADRFELRQGDAHSLPLAAGEWGSFDLAHARFLLEHVPDPLAVVAGMVRSVRPGGRIVLADDDHDLLRLWPEPPGVRAIWGAYMRTYERIGCDPIVGRRLVELLHAAGARPVRSTWIYFGACAGEARFPAFVSNLERIFLGARASILAGGELAAGAFDGGIDELRAWGRRPDATFWYAISFAEGERV
jgi:SAM-dependent methyltransferase